MNTLADREFMARALRLAERGRFWARPNPHVGCVIVRDQSVVGEGFTQPAGGDHAEVVALKKAGTRADGATAYVTLEPCSHFGRTPPCADALLRAGIRRVVVGLEDPNPRVAGAGLAALRSAGVKVETGLLSEQVERQLAGFLMRHRCGRARLRLKVAMSLDGRTAMASGESQWITGSPARVDVQRLRAASCAVLTGVGTVLADDCALTIRDAGFEDACLPPPQRRALRVVLDSRLRTPADARVLEGAQPSLLLHARDARVPDTLLPVDRVALPGSGEGLDLDAVLRTLAQRECNEILLESGPTLAGAALRQRCVDELWVYVAPKLLGSSGRPMLDYPLQRMAEALDLQLLDQRQFGVDQRLVYRPRYSDSHQAG